MTWTARTRGDPQAARTPIQEALAGLDADIPLTNVELLQARLEEATAEMRFSSTLLTLFGLLALLLAVVGLYGVLAYRVRQRLPELGVRMAFGATTGRIFSLVLKQGLLLVGVGLGVGTLLALVVTRGLADQLVGLGAGDPLTYLAVSVLFFLVAAIACTLPAVRATRTDPSATLGGE